MKVTNEKIFSVPEHYFGISGSDTGYTLNYSVDGKTHAAEFNVKQLAGEIDSTNISPIWRDSWINIDADYNYFRLVNKKTN